MNILFLSLLDFTDINHKSIYSDLLREFHKNGHFIYAVSPVEKRKATNTQLVNDDRIIIFKPKVGNIQKTNLLEKGLSTLTLETIILEGIKKTFSDVKFDLVLYTTPPITFDKVIRYVKKRDGAKSYLLLKDIFPQNAVDLNMFSKKSPIYLYFRHKEKALYRNSDYIGCMSRANVEYILRHNSGINPKTVEVCPNSIDPAKIEIVDEEKNSIRDKYGIPNNKTVFIYGGNLGKPQGVDFLIECIQANEKNTSSFILVVGSGTEFGKLDRFFKESNPINAKLISQLPKTEYDLLVNSSDVGLIFLDKRFTIPNFPSRLLPYMQASMPVLAATDKNTDIGEVIENGTFGFWCESGSLEKFNKLVTKLCNLKLRNDMGKKAREYLEDNYTAKHSYEIIINHFNK
ncbi:glycosyltransferase family 4 protein [Proteiniclasticum sp. BAD-10]|uniref:Glycosyltransferase family 4 protein n=1 Tax=Proteiniclasticum sediminis TaxID=2804028 RepID=A0A941CPT5_9CLOT|nr:glycosyltransferase family 4 protein [Proteiniclasticum sediminis]MBR0575573.1 glycosyltransferase family 4 protein [Proteiniclasticum sediminis]